MYADYLQEGLPLDQADYFSGYGAHTPGQIPGEFTQAPPPGTFTESLASRFGTVPMSAYTERMPRFGTVPMSAYTERMPRFGQTAPQMVGGLTTVAGLVRTGLGVWLLTRMARGAGWPTWVQWVGAGWITLIGVTEIAGGGMAMALTAPSVPAEPFPPAPEIDPSLIV